MRFIGDIALDAEVRAIASGAITDGEPVVVNSTGTVSGVTDATAQTLGSEVVFESAVIATTATVFDSNSNRVVVAYQDQGNSNYGTAIVGTISGTSVSYGTAVVFESAQTNWVNATFDSSNNKVVITYQDAGNSSYGTAIVGTVDSSDNSISYGSPTVFNSATTNQGKITFDSSNNKVVVAYNNGGDSGHGYAIVGTVSGTSISFGSAAEFENAVISDPAITFDSSNNKIVIVYRDEGNSNYGTAIVGTVSSTSISFGSASAYHAVNASETAMTFDSSNNKVVVAYTNGGDADHGYAVVGTVSGTSISFGTPVEFRNADQRYNAIAFDSTASKVVISFREDDDSNKGKLVVGTVSGTGISFGDPVEFNGGKTSATSSAFDSSNNRVIISYKDAGSSGYGTSIIFANPEVTNITTENYIGIANAAYADGQKATVKTTGSIARNIPEITNASTTTVYGESVASTFDSNSNKVVIAYTDSGNSNYGTAIVGTISGTGISFGTAAVFNAGGTTMNSITFDSNSNKVVIAYIDGTGNNDGKVVIGTVSGTNISFGSEVTYASARALMPSISFDTNSNKVLIFFSGDSEQGKGIVGTVSGTSISFGSVATFNTDKTGYMKNTSSFNGSTNKHIILFRDEESFSNHGKLAIATISGTNVSFGSKITFETGGYITFMASTFDSNANKTVLVYQDTDNSNYGTARVLSADGSLGTAVVFESAYIRYPQCTFDSNSNRVVITYRDSGNSNYGTAVVGSVSGTGISFGTPVVFETASIEDNNTITFDSNSNKVVIAYEDAGNSNRVTAIVGTVDSSDNSISFGTAAVLNSAPAILTIGQQYFVQTDGSLGTSADSPSVIAGTAIGASELIVKG